MNNLEKELLREWIYAAQEFAAGKLGLVRLIEKTLTTYNQMCKKTHHYDAAMIENYGGLKMGLKMARTAISMTASQDSLPVKQRRKAADQAVENILLSSKDYRDVLGAVIWGGLGELAKNPEICSFDEWTEGMNGTRKRFLAMRSDVIRASRVPKATA